MPTEFYGDVPGVRVVPAHPTNYTVAMRTTYDLIVLHITDGHPPALGTAKMFAKEGNGASAHFVVGQAPVEIIQCVRLKDIAWHAKGRKLIDPAPDAVDKYKQNSLVNNRSIGIEHSARSPKEWSKSDPGLPLTEPQLWLSAKLVAYLLKAGGLTVDRQRVQGHCEADPNTTHTDCPNRIWRWEPYMDMVQQAYNII